MKGEVGTKMYPFFVLINYVKNLLIFYLLGYNYNERECE